MTPTPAVAPAATDDTPLLRWTEGQQNHAVRWRSEAGVAPPRRVRLADDTLTADSAYRLACEGTGLLWRGDFQNARQLLQALARRTDAKPKPKRTDAAKPPPTLPEAFNLHRQAQAQRARVLGMVLIQLDGQHRVPLRRAADLQPACTEAWGPGDGQPSVASLRELLGLIGAHEWRKKGVPIAALGGEHIHPHYGVFSPVRGEYIDLVALAELPRDRELAFDIGTGTGVLAALLARRGMKRVIATDMDPRALACAKQNVQRLGVADRVQVLQADLFPEGRAPLVLCNPPWLPARPSSPIEHAIYDEGSRMLRGFLAGLADHLAPGGEGWLILSDLAEHLGLRPREQLMGWIEAAGLRVAGKLETRPKHPKAGDRSDPLHEARAREVTSLWRLVAGAKVAG